MEVARKYVERCRVKRRLDADLRAVKQEIADLEPQILELIENDMLPESFKIDGASVYTRSQVWASPADGNHTRLAEVLREVGLVEYLPTTVNSHSISAYVREHIDPDTGELVGLDPRLVEALKITETTKAVVNG